MIAVALQNGSFHCKVISFVGGSLIQTDIHVSPILIGYANLEYNRKYIPFHDSPMSVIPKNCFLITPCKRGLLANPPFGSMTFAMKPPFPWNMSQPHSLNTDFYRRREVFHPRAAHHIRPPPCLSRVWCAWMSRFWHRISATQRFHW